MFKKIIAVVLLLILSISSVFTLDMKEAEPYSKDEFPKWELNLRRSEIIFFGTIPIAYPITALACNITNKNLGFWEKIGISAAAAAGVALTDFIIGVVKAK